MAAAWTATGEAGQRGTKRSGSGGLFFDFDSDGWIDIFLVDVGSEADPVVARTARHRLYRNRRNGTFEDVTSSSGIRHREYGMGACAGDYDNDGLVDLYVTNVGPNVLYRNSGGGAFTDATVESRVGPATLPYVAAFLSRGRTPNVKTVNTLSSL